MILVPISMNCGTATVMPVSSLAGLGAAGGGGALQAGSVSTTFSTTVVGSSTATGLSS